MLGPPDLLVAGDAGFRYSPLLCRLEVANIVMWSCMSEVRHSVQGPGNIMIFNAQIFILPYSRDSQALNIYKNSILYFNKFDKFYYTL